MFLLGLKNTLMLSLICAPLVWVLSFVIAALLNRLQPGGAFFRNSILLPYLMPSSAMLLIWLVAVRLWRRRQPSDRGFLGLSAGALAGGRGAARADHSAVRVEKSGLCSGHLSGGAADRSRARCTSTRRLRAPAFLRPDVPHHAAAGACPSAFLVIILVDQRLQDLQGGLLHRRRVPGRGGLYAAELHEQHVSAKLNYQNVTTAAYSFAIIVFALFGALFLHAAQADDRRSPEEGDR